MHSFTPPRRCTGLAPAPFAGMVLQQHGARVIRIDRTSPGLYPDFLGRGKESIAVNLKHASGVAALRSLLPHADVVLDPFRPGVLEGLGLGPTHLHAANPALVMARITGYGQTSPWSSRPGHDINYMAASGVLALLGRPGAPPAPPANLLADFAGGGLAAVGGIMMAAWQAQRTGQGAVVDVSMTDCARALGTLLLEFNAAGLHPGPPGTNLLDGGAPFYATYDTAGGGCVAVGALEPPFFAALLQGLALPSHRAAEMVKRQMNHATWPSMRQEIQAAFMQHTLEHWEVVFGSGAGLDACVTAVVEGGEVGTHPHWAAPSAVGPRLHCGLQDGTGDAGARYHTPGQGGEQGGGGLALSAPVPLLHALVPMPGDEEGKEESTSVLPLPCRGQHTSTVLQELGGLTAQDVAALEAAGAVLSAARQGNK